VLDRAILGLDLSNRKLVEVLAKVEQLEKALREVAEGKIKAKRILEYYGNPHTPPRNQTIIQREINKSEERKRRRPQVAGDAARAAITPRSAGRRPRLPSTGQASAEGAGARTWGRSAPTTRSWRTYRTYPRWRSSTTRRMPAGA